MLFIIFKALYINFANSMKWSQLRYSIVGEVFQTA